VIPQTGEAAPGGGLRAYDVGWDAYAAAAVSVF
jgi:hypothetical protein